LPLLGQFLEVSLATDDIAASVRFYERLGFEQLATGDMWPHLYGVLTDGRAVLGLHQRPAPSPALTFVYPGLAAHVAGLRAAAIEPESTNLGEESLHTVQLRDPGGQAITLLEARTYSPRPRQIQETLCGYFLHYGLTASEPAASVAFWEQAGFVALEETSEPYAHQPLTSDGLDLAIHRERTFDAPLLVFEAEHLPERVARLRELEIRCGVDLPRGLTSKTAALVEAPEGTCLLLVQPRA
jgi:catechol 2,3-dioxygenase-like lactoylglutathione lyase family enzyme